MELKKIQQFMQLKINTTHNWFINKRHYNKSKKIKISQVYVKYVINK
jgi:hypothetical protein